MAIPSGAGTEVLKRQTADSLNNATHSFTTVPADHIWTLISLTICAQSASANTFSITINNGTSDIDIISNSTSIAGKATFVFSDRLVLTAGDTLKVFYSGNYGEVWFSYIDQHF